MLGRWRSTCKLLEWRAAEVTGLQPSKRGIGLVQTPGVEEAGTSIDQLVGEPEMFHVEQLGQAQSQLKNRM
jgi:hypothetical protein